MVPLLSLLAQGTPKSVIAQQGDGIYSILRKQGLDPVEYYNAFLKLNEENLNEENALYAGRTYLLPLPLDTPDNMEDDEAAADEAYYPIFGEDQAYVTPVSDKLQGTVYYLISGHGGPDPGAVDEYRGTLIAEDEYAYDVTLRLAKELLSHGAQVFLIVRDEDDGIRDETVLETDHDEVVYPDRQIPLNQLERLEQRVDAVNKLYLKHRDKYQRLLVLHVDSRNPRQNIDVFFYHHDKSTKGKQLAESLHNTFLKKYKRFQPNRDYTGTFTDRSSLYMVKNTLAPMAYIEIGNLKNKKDQKRILNYENRQAVAKWLAEG
ncbi:MAG: N-acetylmuramoyl-L-alanine amidase, partial [Eudoraea sp.]|nr:N-acetylmuramoyl-L-alanine amidase [Eudoraea sp.]